MRATFSKIQLDETGGVKRAPLRLPLFVYGTLRSDRCNAKELAPYSPSIERGFASGTLHYVDYVDDDGSRRVTVALDPSDASTSPVAGELVAFDGPNELHALAALDQRELAFQNEELSAGDRDYVYIRSLIKVLTEAGEEVIAWTYVMVSKHFKPHLKVPANEHGIVEYREISAEQYDLMLSELTGEEYPIHPPPVLDPPVASPWRHTALLVLAITAYFMAYLLRVAPTTMSQALSQSIGVGATGLGTLAAGYSYITMSMQVPAGVMADRLGPPRLLMYGCIAAAAGCVLFGLSNGFASAALGRVLIGLGCSVLFVTMLKVIAVLYPTRFASVTGVGMIIGAAGSVFAGVPLAEFMEATSWRVASLAMGLACALVAGASCYLAAGDSPMLPSVGTTNLTDRKPAWRTQIREVLALRTIRLCFVVNLGICGAFMSFTGLWAVPYLMASFGYSLVQASGHVSAYFAAFSLSCLVIGRLSDRLGNRMSLMVMGSCTFVALLFILLEIQAPTIVTTYLIFVALGIFSCAFTLTWGIAKDAASPAVSGMAMGLVNTGGFAGAAVLQQVAGGLMDLLWQGQVSEATGLRTYSLTEYRACLAVHVLLAIFGLCAAVLLWRESRRTAPAVSGSEIPVQHRQNEEVAA